MRRMQEAYRDEKKELCMCFLDIKKAFDLVASTVMNWAMRKKNLSEVTVRAVMGLYHRAKMKV